MFSNFFLFFNASPAFFQHHLLAEICGCCSNTSPVLYISEICLVVFQQHLDFA